MRDESQITAEAVARRSYGKLVAFLAAGARDVAAAEDALSDAFTAALTEWPLKGCPSNPEAWLLTVARRKAIDGQRRQRRMEQLDPTAQRLHADVRADSEFPDQRLALMFACAHPAIDASIRAPLVLQTVLGVEANTIASAFLTSPSAMSKRLVRAKDKIRQAGIPFRILEREELPGRLETVLNAIYAAFTAGWNHPGETDVTRRELTAEAIYLARLAAELMPNEPEASGLLALMLYAEARRLARRDSSGEYVPLSEQDPQLWDMTLIEEAEALVRRTGGFARIGRFQVEAALQSAHVYRRCTGRSNWHDVVRLYDVLFTLTGSPVVAINRALAFAEIHGARAGLAEIHQIEADVRIEEYQPYWAARAELLTKAGEHDAARDAYDLAIGLEQDPAVRRFLLRRQSGLRS